MVDKLIEDYNNNDPTIRDLLNFWTVYIVPSLNPDGKKSKI
jgi:murein tripeptide amidase MpaA